jgi:Nif-specific regulatory protein
MPAFEANVAIGGRECAQRRLTPPAQHASDLFPAPVGSSRAMLIVMEDIQRIKNSDATVLLTGESGTGKELVARMIHRSSRRAKSTLAAVNCGAVVETLAESELFGHERGAFTGATALRVAKFEAAKSRTIFLDEIGELALPLQAKLLRVLDGYPFERVGGNKPILTDARVIAATNRDLQDEVKSGRFRRDLFYRLNVICIELPPLRKRLDDIPELVQHFLDQHCQKCVTRYRFTSAAIQALTLHCWPGNIRELKNVIERTVTFAGGKVIGADDIRWDSSRPGQVLNVPSAAAPSYEPLRLEEIERRHILNTVAHTRGNKTRAAIILGINPATLSRKLKEMEFGMEHSWN